MGSLKRWIVQWLRRFTAHFPALAMPQTIPKRVQSRSLVFGQFSWQLP
jgi:hypothetical protein